MHTERRQISLGFAQEPVPEGTHICYIYNDDKERNRIMSKFLNQGLNEKEKVLYFVDTVSTEVFEDSMSELGLDIQSSKKDFALSDAGPTYCPDGPFCGDRMINFLGDFYDDAIENGYTGVRGSGEMSWSLVDGITKTEELLRYEAEINNAVKTRPITAICQYDARKFDGNTIMDVLSVHPAMIVRGQIVKNPYYVEPEIFLKEYQARDQEG